MRLLAQEEKAIVEGAGAVGVAPLLAGLPEAAEVVVLTGGNLDPERLGALLASP